MNSDLIEPDNMAVIVADRGSIMVVRLQMTMRDARVVGRIGLVNMLWRSDPRAQHRDSGQQMNGGASRAEHRAIMFAQRSRVKRRVSEVIFCRFARYLSEGAMQHMHNNRRWSSVTRHGIRPIRLFGISLVAAIVLVAAAAVRPAEAQTKTARGTATTVTDVSLTVKVGDKDMTFDVDNKTVVQAPGAGRQTRTAQAAGAAGIKLTNVIQSGQPVLVTYRETNGKNLATDISRISTAGSGGGSMSEPSKVATGTVKSVSASSLVVTSEGKDSTFAIDQATSVVGRGAGTSAAAAGGRVVITSLVGSGDSVRVSYRGGAGMMRATEIRVTAKAR